MRGGLLALVEAAADRARQEHVNVNVRELIAKVCLECFGGNYAWAVDSSFPYDLYTPEEWWAECARLDSDPEWAAFHGTVRLAADIDAYLFAMERAARVLARDCRDDLDLLGVLGDWCEDAGLPRAAEEARYFAERLRGWRRGPGPFEEVSEGGWFEGTVE